MKKKFMLALSLVIFSFILGGNVTYAKSYSGYSTKGYAWGLVQNYSHKTPSGEMSIKDLKKFNAIYIGPHGKKKVMYLTFDCGYENGHTKRILDTLKKQKIKALFFVTESYIKENRNLVKRMKKEGHYVGNHTCTHPDLSQKSAATIRREITNCAKTMKKLTGYTMDKFLRPPMGCFSKRSLAITKDLGYTTVLWSMALYDYDENNQPGKSYVVKYFNDRYHNGAIPLLHVISKSDTEALATVISNLKKKGFTFKQLPKSK